MNGTSHLEKLLCPSPNSAWTEGTVTPSQAAASWPHPGGAAGQQGGICWGRDAQGPAPAQGPTSGTFVSSWSSLPLGLDSASLAAASCFFHSSMSCSAFLGEVQGRHAELRGSAVVLQERTPPPPPPFCSSAIPRGLWQPLPHPNPVPAPAPKGSSVCQGLSVPQAPSLVCSCGQSPQSGVRLPPTNQAPSPQKQGTPGPLPCRL